MTSKDLIDACDILIKLEQEFATEEAKLYEISNEHAMKIDELDQQITTFRRNEDVDFRVFSPRNISTGTSDKIKALESEKKSLEKEKRDADKQLKYYSGKTEMIGKVLELLRGDLKEESDDDSSTVRKSRDPFAFLNEDFDPEEEIIEERKYDEIAELFKQPDSKTETDNKKKPAKSEKNVITDIDILADEQDEDEEIPVKDIVIETPNGVPVDEVERVCHKVEFCEKIITNDGIRAKLEIKNIVADMKDLIRAYS